MPVIIDCLLSSLLHFTFLVAHLSISVFLAAISVLLSSFEDISSILFDLASDFYGSSPRASFPTEKCAILVLGAQEGVGRNAALSFSELGYTVFALCPNRQELERSGHSLPPERSRDVASLLYIWHNRKERSRSIPWGLVAPMQLNLWSRSQREAVHETVRAHCNTYDLHLVALVISHDTSPLRGTSLSFMNALDATQSADVLSKSHVLEDAWRISVLDEVIEPVLMACDYKTLLAEASGRVIILSNFAEGSPLSSLSLTSRTGAAKNLAEMLEPQGIRVSSIYFGPLAQYSTEVSPESHSVDRYVEAFLSSLVRSIMGRISTVSGDPLVHVLDSSPVISSDDLPKDWQETFNVLARKISRQLVVQDHLLLDLLRRVVQTRHPKFTYTIGLYPVLRLTLESAPVSARIAVKSLKRWAKSLERVA